MNVTGLNMSSTIATAVNAEAIPGLSVALDGENPQGFIAALTTQLGMLNELNMQTELSQAPASALATPLPTTSTAITTEQPATTSAVGTTPIGQDIAALLGDKLPVSYKVNDDAAVDEHLAAVTDAINYKIATPASESSIPATLVVAESENAVTESISQTLLPQTAQTKTAVNTAAKSVQDKKASLTEDENSQTVAVTALVSPLVAIVPATTAQLQTTESAESSSLTLSTAKPETASLAAKTALVDDKDVAALKPTELLNQTATGEKPVVAQFAEDGKLTFEEQKPTSTISTDLDAAPKAPVDLAKLDKLMVNKTDVPAVAKPLNHPDWGKEVGERIVWMNNKALPAAEIRINPEHLGPITVRIDVSQDQASVSFTAQHGVVRDALEASIPKLKEMMSAQNLDLATVNVSQQHSSSNQGQSQAQNFFQMDKQGQHDGANPMDEMGAVTEELEESNVTVTKGLLSMYA